MRKTKTYREKLVPRIIDLIDGYSTDSILKEYLQNADDSGATELIITFDKRIHHKLSGTACAPAKGPALLIENNSFFKDSDFESIAEISAAGKRNDPSKTGRFGQGFSCSFSVSDDPSLVSSGRALWFDVLNHSVNAEDSEYISEWDDLNDVGIQDWLNSFCTGKAPDFINKTIFRLPLRTQVSDISSEVFKFHHFLAWCDEWKQNASNLLFLRNIHKLVLQEITEDGNLIKHLVIETVNTSEIETINRSIQADFDKFENAIDMCNYWLSDKKILPHYQYVQEFLVAEYCREKNTVNTNSEKWAVVNGLFNGPDDILIEKAIDALSIKPTGRKVLPWAGVAIKLNAENQPDTKHESSFYSFLPLDIFNPFPVSIHGWFDLDSKRTEITFTGGGEVKEILKSWNRLLLEHAVANAWAELIEFTKGHQYFEHYFSLWPKKTGNKNYDAVVPSFYQSVVNLNTVYVVNREKGEWLKPRSNQWVFKDFEDQNLLKILTQSYSIILGNPSRDICKNLNSAGAKITSLDAKTIYAEIRKLEGSIGYPLTPEQLPYPFIKDKKDLLGIVSFLIKDMESRELDFSEMPFSLSVDGKIYPPTAPMFAEENMELSILQNKSRLVLHSELSRFQKEQYGSLSEYWLDDSFENLLKVIDFYFKDFQLAMEWVESLVDLIANASRDEVQTNLRTIKNLPIALCEGDIWLPLNSGTRSTSPLYIETSSLNQYELYRSLGFKLFDIRFHEKYAKLKRHSDILMKVSEEIIVKQIINNSDIDLTTDETLRLFVLEEIADNLDWIKHLNNAEKTKFINIALVKTDSGCIRKLDSECKLYLSAGFTAPNHLSNVKNSYEVIITESDKERELYRNFGVTTLEPYTYLKDVVLPYLNNRENLDQTEATVRWIVAEWNNIKDSCDESQLKDIVTTLSEINIVPRSSDGELFKAKELYHPVLYRSLPTDLQLDSFCVKLLDDVSEHQWTEFLDDLGVSEELLIKHFQRLISEIEMNNDVNRAISLWNYVISNFEQFERVLIGKRTLIDELSKAAIFPVEDVRDQFSPTTTWSALSKTSSLITSREYYLLGLSYFSTHRNIGLEKIEDAELRRKLVDRLGFVKIDKEKVIKNFEKLKDIQATNNKELNQIVKFAKRFYSYVGRFKDIFLNDSVKKNSIRLGHMWLSPSRVFENKFKISNTYCWNELISNDSNAYVSEGLRKLGVTPEPKSPLLLELLNELPQQIPLESTQLSDAKEILDLLRRLHRVGEFEPGRLCSLLSTENTLERIGSLLVNDSPNYDKAESKSEELKFVANKYRSIAESAHVKSILRDSVGHLNKQLSKEATSIKVQDLKVLFEYLSKKHFKDAIRRIYAHENDGEIELFPEGGFIPQSVHLMEYLVIDFYIDELWIYSIDSMTTYREGEKLFVVNQEDDDLWDSLASYIAESAMISDPDNLMLIRRLIKDPRSKSEIEGFLDNKNIARLHIQDDSDLTEETDFYIEQAVSLPEDYDNNNGALFDEEFDDFTHDESNSFRTEVDDSNIDFEEYYERDSVQRTRSKEPATTERGEEKNERINTASGSQNTINIRQKDIKRTFDNRERPSERSTSEIDPPIRPKTSQSTANEVPPERKKLKLKDVRNRSKKLNGNISAPTKPSGLDFPGAPEGISDAAEKQLETPRQSNADKISPNNRLPIYVYPSDDTQNGETTKSNSATEIGDKGEDYIVLHQKRYLMSPTNRIEKAPKNNKGYDLIEFSGEDVIRFIEVKTLTGIWGEGGVSLTSAQFDFALENKHWWLFVVENVNTENIEVHRFENPVRLVNRFSFDSSWKKMLDVDKKADVSLPEIGDKVKLPGEDTEYEVIAVKPRGEINLYTLISASGKTTKKPYNVSWVKV